MLNDVEEQVLRRERYQSAEGNAVIAIRLKNFRHRRSTRLSPRDPNERESRYPSGGRPPRHRLPSSELGAAALPA
jgi:hypothetical protein